MSSMKLMNASDMPDHFMIVRQGTGVVSSTATSVSTSMGTHALQHPVSRVMNALRGPVDEAAAAAGAGAAMTADGPAKLDMTGAGTLASMNFNLNSVCQYVATSGECQRCPKAVTRLIHTNVSPNYFIAQKRPCFAQAKLLGEWGGSSGRIPPRRQMKQNAQTAKGGPSIRPPCPHAGFSPPHLLGIQALGVGPKGSIVFTVVGAKGLLVCNDTCEGHKRTHPGQTRERCWGRQPIERTLEAAA